MDQFVNDDAYPWRTVVLVEARFGAEWYSGSGVLVGRNDVLTASHIIYDPLFGLADEVIVYPSYNPNQNNIGFNGVFFDYYDSFDPDGDGRITAGDNQLGTLAGTELDIALITLDTAAGDQFGWMGIDYALNQGVMNVTGYPGLANDFMYNDIAYAFDDDIDYFVHLENFIISPGNSGGPIWYDDGAGPYVVGVVSTSLAGTDLSGHQWLGDRIRQNDSFIVDLGPIDLATLVFSSAQNTDQFGALSAAYQLLLRGVPSQEGFDYLITTNNDTNFGSFSTVRFNEENIYINVMNALYQGNGSARAAFADIVPFGSLQAKLAAVYDFIIHPAEQSASGRAYFISQSDFYWQRASELGISGSDGAALVGMAALTKIAAASDLAGIGDTINDLIDAVASETSRIPETGGLTAVEFADGNQFDGDDGFFALARTTNDEGFDYLGNTQSNALVGDAGLPSDGVFIIGTTSPAELAA